MPLTYHVWLKKYASPQADMISTLRNVLNQEKFSRNWLSQFVASEPLLSLRITELSGIPKMTDYLCWRVQLGSKGAVSFEASSITLGDIAAYNLGDSWAVVFEQHGYFSELFQSYANAVVKELIGAKPIADHPLPPNSVLIHDDLASIHSSAELLEIQLSHPHQSTKEVQNFLRRFDKAWSAIQAGSPAYYQYKIGWERNTQPSPKTPNRPHANGDKMSWPIFGRNRYNSVSYSTSAWLDLRLGVRPSVIIRSANSEWSAILPFVSRLLLAMQESSLVDLTTLQKPLAMPMPLRQGIYLKSRPFVEILKDFARERLWQHGWGWSDLRLSIENSWAWIYPFVWWRVLGATRSDDKSVSSVGEIFIASLSTQEQIVELSSQPSSDQSAFMEFTRELLDYTKEQGIQWRPLPLTEEQAKEDGPKSSHNRNTKIRRKSKQGARRKKIFVPKTKRDRDRWKKAWKIICKTRRTFKKEYKEGNTENPKPSHADLIEALKDGMGWNPSQKTVSRIVIAGEAGKLK